MKCPKCGGPADNGHDREDPPNPYYCKKCSIDVDIQCGNYRNVSTGFAYVVQAYRGGQWVDLREFSGWSESRDLTRALDAEERTKHG